MTHAKTGQHGVGQGQRLLRRDALVAEWLSDVVSSVQVRQQVAFLENKRNRPLSKFNQFLPGQSRHVLAGEAYRTSTGLHQSTKALHEGGFSRPGGSNHGDGFTGLHVDVQASQGHDVAVLGFGFVNVVQAVCVKNRIAHLHSPLSTLAKSALSARRVVTSRATTTAENTAKDTRMIWVHG